MLAEVKDLLGSISSLESSRKIRRKSWILELIMGHRQLGRYYSLVVTNIMIN
jgi:hypothetical protein